MELKDTIKLMQSDSYVDRFKAEYYQLAIRVDKLEIMLENYKAGTLQFTPECSYELLHTQLVHMYDYKNTLETRAVLENINL